MSTKRCAFRDCYTFTNPSHPCSETFYAFPKDAERCKLWLKLGACREPIPYTMRYFCSKHFDESKYVAHNQRRKQLLSTAVPWPYNESPQKEVESDEVDTPCVVSTIDDNDEDDISTIERFEDDAVSVEISNDISHISDTMEEALQNYEYQQVTGANEFSIAVPTEKKSQKRKLETSVPTDDVQPGPSNLATSSTAIDADEYLKLDDYLDESKIIDSSNLTTFIFKGQEYIQMPKDDYVNEKMALMQKIKSYEEVLKNVKHLLDGVWI